MVVQVVKESVSRDELLNCSSRLCSVHTAASSVTLQTNATHLLQVSSLTFQHTCANTSKQVTFSHSLACLCPVWARGRCRISSPRFLAECCKRQLNQVSFVVLYFRLSTFFDLYWVCLSIFSCAVLFVSISQVIGCEDLLRNDLYCVKWGVKLYSIHPSHSLATSLYYCCFLATPIASGLAVSAHFVQPIKCL